MTSGNVCVCVCFACSCLCVWLWYGYASISWLARVSVYTSLCCSCLPAPKPGQRMTCDSPTHKHQFSLASSYALCKPCNLCNLHLFISFSFSREPSSAAFIKSRPTVSGPRHMLLRSCPQLVSGCRPPFFPGWQVTFDQT